MTAPRRQGPCGLGRVEIEHCSQRSVNQRVVQDFSNLSAPEPMDSAWALPPERAIGIECCRRCRGVRVSRLAQPWLKFWSSSWCVWGSWCACCAWASAWDSADACSRATGRLCLVVSCGPWDNGQVGTMAPLLFCGWGGCFLRLLWLGRQLAIFLWERKGLLFWVPSLWGREVGVKLEFS